MKGGQAKAMGHHGSRTEETSWDRLVYSASCPEYFTDDTVPSVELDSTEELTCAVGELVLEQSSELDEDVDVGVMETVLLLLLPEEPLDCFTVLGFLFLVWIPSFFIASGRGTPCNLV